MSPFDDYVGEMPTDELDGFVAGVRAAATRMPEPSPTLAHLLTSGVSSEPSKRSRLMRVKAYIAGLGVAAKVALGAGVAAATATAAAVAPVAFMPAKEHSVTAGGDSKQKDTPAVVDKTMTSTTPTTAKPVAPQPEKPAPPTTLKPYVEPKPKVTTPTTQKPSVEPKPDKPTTTTTEKPKPPTPLHDITVSCESNGELTKVYCSWTATASPEHFYYKLVRSNADGSDWQKLYKSEDQREYWDTTPVADHTYEYFVYSLREDGAIVAESNVVLVTCC